ALLVYQPGIVDLAGGIVEDRYQVLIALARQPLMPTSVDMQEHAWQRSVWSLLVMAASLSFASHQTALLKRLLDPAVAQLDLVLFVQLVDEVADVEVAVHLAIQPQHLLHCLHRHPFRGRSLPAAVKQPVIAVPSSYRARHRLIVRGLTPMISAACIQVISPPIALKITSCTSIARLIFELGWSPNETSFHASC